MTNIFLKVLEASFYGSIVTAVILLLRLILRKAPRSTICLLWLLAGIRLLMPFSIESNFSLQPDHHPISKTSQEQIVVYDLSPSESTLIATPSETAPQPGAVTGSTSTLPTQTIPDASEKTGLTFSFLLPYLWLTGMLVLGLYSFASYLRLKRRVFTAKSTVDGCRECDTIGTAFVLGFLDPQIYLPTGLSPVSRAFIISHERSHIDHLDHWWKLAGFCVLTIHWFNPLVWVGYHMLCRDIEMACDERVVRNMNVDQRKAYSAALLSCSTSRTHIGACPIAFGEVSVKQRILSVLRYRRPGFWVSMTAAAAVIFVLVCFLTNPASASDSPADDIPLDDYVIHKTTIVTELEGATEEDALLARCFNALTAFQSQDSYSAIVIGEFNTYDILNNHSLQQFWCHGKDWLRISEMSEAKLTNIHLYKNGQLYNRIEDGYSEEASVWSEVHNADSDAFRPWIERFVWNADTISLYDHIEEQGSEYITLTVAEELTMSGFTVPSFTLTFEFVEEDTLAAINLRMESEEESSAMNPTRESIYISMQPSAYSQEEIAALIQDHYLSVVDSITEPLANALKDAIQSAEEVYHISELSMIDRVRCLGTGYAGTHDTAITFLHTEESIQSAAIQKLTPFVEAGLIPEDFQYEPSRVFKNTCYDPANGAGIGIWQIDLRSGDQQISITMDDETEEILCIIYGAGSYNTGRYLDPSATLNTFLDTFVSNSSGLDLSSLEEVSNKVTDTTASVHYLLRENENNKVSWGFDVNPSGFGCALYFQAP